MANNDASSLPRRRAGTRSVNYSEKEADADLIRRIDHLEKTSNQSKGQNRVGRPRSNGSINEVGSKVRNSSGVSKNKYQSFLNDKSVKWNFIPSLPPTFRKTSRFSNILDMKDAVVNFSHNTLKNPDGLLLKAGETIYMVSEPPGEPYYIGRVVEFVSKSEFVPLVERLKDYTNELPAKYFQVKMNWFYRPRDIQDKVSNFDTRLVYASLHEDVCPIISYRGKCTVLHVDEIENQNCDRLELMTRPNIFYFDQLFDRYSLTYYYVTSTEKLLKLQKASSFLYVLSKRFRYVFAEEKYPLEEILRKYVIKEASSSGNENDQGWDDRCTVCREWCPTSQRLKCDECFSCVHLYCMDPPLDKKPNKGIIWLCFNCLKCHEGTTEALKELNEEKHKQIQNIQTSKDNLDSMARNLIKKGASKLEENLSYQYLGQHMVCHMEDLLHSSFYIPYPFKNSRTGTKYQWSGCTDCETWKQVPYDSSNAQERGSSKTSDILWRTDKIKMTDKELTTYIQRCKAKFPKILDIVPESCNFLDMIMKALINHNYDSDLAFSECEGLLSRETLKEPTFSDKEIEKFENAVAKYGSELHLVCKDVSSQSMSMIVRYYYHWKKTPNGKRIWGGFDGRPKNKAKSKVSEREIGKVAIKGKSSRTRRPTKVVLENQSGQIKDELRFMDDSCFDTESMSLVRTCFKCVFCDIDYSPLWYKITGGSDDEQVKKRVQVSFSESPEKLAIEKREVKGISKDKNDRLDALCIRCARLWRRYGIKWQQPLDVLKRLSGNSIYILNASISKAFEELNPNLLTVNPDQARCKLLEWEQIIDSELILRQRLDLTKNPEHVVKLRTSTLASRSALYRLSKKSFDKRQVNVDYLKMELEDYLAKMMRKKSKTVTNAPKPVSKAKDDMLRPSKKPVKLIEQHVTPKINDRKKIATPSALIVSNYGVQLAPNGQIQINIVSTEGKLGALTIDSNFVDITVDETLLDQLISTSIKKRKLVHECDDSTQLFHKIRKIENGDNVPLISSVKQSILPRIFKLPKVVHENSTSALLEAYHSSVASAYISINTKSLSSTKGDSNGDIKHLEFCSVCKQKFKEYQEDRLLCRNCGISVHYYCYGIKLHPPSSANCHLKEFKWLCDPCSNDLNPVVATNYQCNLCYSKNLDDNPIKGQYDGAYRDALKCTAMASWTHVACAIFNKDIKFGSSTSLQPILNSKKVLIKNANISCGICGLQGGGLVKCDLCDKSSHVTCAQRNPSFSLVFKRMDSSLHHHSSHKPEPFRLSTALLCENHETYSVDSKDQYLPLDATTGETAISLMKVFMSRQEDQGRHSMVYERFLEQDYCFKNGMGIVNTDSKTNHEPEHGEETPGIYDIKEIKELFGKLHDPNQSETALKKGKVPFSKVMLEAGSLEHSFSARAGKPLSKPELASIVDGINPDSFDIKLLKDRKETKKRNFKASKILNNDK